MTTTVFTNNSTRTDAAWFQTLNDLAYNLFQAVDAVQLTAATARAALKTAALLTSVAGTNTVTATSSPAPAAYASGDSYVLIPANANTGATTLNLNSLGAKNLFSDGGACVGGELTANVPVIVVYDGTQFNIASRAAATQADQETSTSLTKFVSPGKQQFHPSAAKAWIQFNGTGTPASTQGYNISSITDNGAADYTINFTTSFSSSSYGAAGVTGVTGGVYIVKLVSKIAGAVRINVLDGSFAVTTDSSDISMVFYGDQ